jgi:hypothetical protein
MEPQSAQANIFPNPQPPLSQPAQAANAAMGFFGPLPAASFLTGKQMKTGKGASIIALNQKNLGFANGAMGGSYLNGNNTNGVANFYTNVYHPFLFGPSAPNETGDNNAALALGKLQQNCSPLPCDGILGNAILQLFQIAGVGAGANTGNAALNVVLFTSRDGGITWLPTNIGVLIPALTPFPATCGSGQATYQGRCGDLFTWVCIGGSNVMVGMSGGSIEFMPTWAPMGSSV